MTEIADHLVPRDGLTNSHIKFAGIDALPVGAGGVVRFNILREDGSLFGTWQIPVGAQPQGTVDAMIAEGHRQMRDVLRQWLYVIDAMGRPYAERSDRPAP